MQEAIAEQEKLQQQLQNSEHKLQLQMNELASYHSEKLVLVKVCTRHFLKNSTVLFTLWICFILTDDFLSIGTTASAIEIWKFTITTANGRRRKI